jgi:hypothetical protein
MGLRHPYGLYYVLKVARIHQVGLVACWAGVFKCISYWRGASRGWLINIVLFVGVFHVRLLA